MTTQTKAADPVRQRFEAAMRACGALDLGGGECWEWEHDDFLERLVAHAYAQARADLIAQLKPVAWVRRHPDGALTAEYLEHDVIESARKQSGAWVPLSIIPEQ